ncbi:MAP3K7IP1 [Lepeophtheirus salmonis]|uniref:MAP3K7IP1 n=2 Tax=Lepeophtheirus salmonis TaxID=72036 RepID=A0A0K2SX55_LEPSM|nr:MAP3K7IP1 [Lepeophtheirus salmonis]CAF2971720.1 MAP3K7IP1 [Lepeophtheirus salmonis]
MSDFASKKMPAEVCLGQIDPSTSDESIKEVLKAAFISSDRDYFESLNESLARALTHNKKTSPESFSSDSGSSATIGVLLDDSRLFIANAGDTGALLISKKNEDTDKEHDLKNFNIVKLSIDHVLGVNEDEELRLQHLGLEPHNLKKVLGGPRGYTRCLGYHRAKSGYFKEEELLLKNAKGVPVLCEPEIHGSIQVGSDSYFLLIYSRPLMDTMMELWDEEDGVDLDKELARLVYEEFESNVTVTGVAQSVVDKIVRLHKDKFEDDVNRFREDITLLVHNLNCDLGSLPSRSRSKSRSSSTREDTTFKAIHTSTTTESSDMLSKQGIESLPVDNFGRILPYVDFSYYNAEWSNHLELTNVTTE